jgi:hypothetical protein
MRAALLFGLALLPTGPAHAQDDVAPGANREGVVHVNAIKNPEMHSYRAIAAGLDTFDDRHALAPAVPQLRFAVRRPGGAMLETDLPTAKLSADAFTLALPVGTDALFDVPRNREAWDADAELVLSRKRKDVRVWPYVRTPGLAASSICRCTTPAGATMPSSTSRSSHPKEPRHESTPYRIDAVCAVRRRPARRTCRRASAVGNSS